MTRRQRLISLVAFGGLMAHGYLHPVSARGLGHGFVGRPSFGAHVLHPMVSPGIRRAFGSRRFAPRHTANPGFSWPWGYDEQGPYYYFYAYPSALPDETAPVGSNQVIPIAAHPPGCRATTYTVPAESGGTSTISITRCY